MKMSMMPMTPFVHAAEVNSKATMLTHRMLEGKPDDDIDNR